MEEDAHTSIAITANSKVADLCVQGKLSELHWACEGDVSELRMQHLVFFTSI